MDEQPEYIDPWADGSKRITNKKLMIIAGVMISLAVFPQFLMPVIQISLVVGVLWFIYSMVTDSVSQKVVKKMKDNKQSESQ